MASSMRGSANPLTNCGCNQPCHCGPASGFAFDLPEMLALVLVTTFVCGCIPVYRAPAETVLTVQMVDHPEAKPITFGMRDASAKKQDGQVLVRARGGMPNEEKSELWWIPVGCIVDPVFDFRRELSITVRPGQSEESTSSCSVKLALQAWPHQEQPLGTDEIVQYEGTCCCTVTSGWNGVRVKLHAVRMEPQQGSTGPILLSGTAGSKWDKD